MKRYATIAVLVFLVVFQYLHRGGDTDYFRTLNSYWNETLLFWGRMKIPEGRARNWQSISEFFSDIPGYFNRGSARQTGAVGFSEKGRLLSLKKLRPIQWEANLQNAIWRAGQEEKWVMVDFFTTWCGWCRRLDEVTYQDPAVRQFLEASFVCVKVDGDLQTGLVRQYAVEGYPTLVFLDGSGKEVIRHPGYMAPALFLKLLEEVTGIVRSPVEVNDESSNIE